MDEARREQIYNDLNLRETGDLLQIWQNKNLDEWEEEVFDIIRGILLERLGTLPPQSTQAQVNELLSSIEHHTQAREFDQALSESQLVIQMAPALAIAYVDRGLVYDEMGQLEKAIADYQEAIRLDPEQDEAWYYLKRVERELEKEFQQSSARQHLDQALEYAYEDEPERALGECEQARQTLPGIATAYNYLGLILEELNRLEPAAEAYLEAVRLNPRYYAARENLGNTRKKLEQEQYRKAALENWEEGQGEEESNLDLAESQGSDTPENTDSAPGWLYMDEKAFVMTGQPGHRTRPGRSGYDYLDTEFEFAHMTGEVIHLSFTGNFRINNPLYFLLLACIGFICCTPLLLGGLVLLQGGWYSIAVILLYSPYWIVGVVLWIDIYLSFRMRDSEAYIQNDAAFF